VGEGKVGEVSVTGVDSLGGGDVGVDSHGGECSSEETSITSGKLGGSEDNLLGGEAIRGSRGEWGELLRGGRHSCELAPSCLSSSSWQRRFLVLLASGGVTSGEGRVTVTTVVLKMWLVQEKW
jgi:hypothetical protein